MLINKIQVYGFFLTYCDGKYEWIKVEQAYMLDDEWWMRSANDRISHS